MEAAMMGIKAVGEHKESRFSGFWSRGNVASMLCWMSAIWAVPAFVMSAFISVLAGLFGFLGSPVDPDVNYGDYGMSSVIGLFWLLIIGVLCMALILWLAGFLIGRTSGAHGRGSRVRAWGLAALTVGVTSQAVLWFISCRLLLGFISPFLGWCMDNRTPVGVLGMGIFVVVLLILALSTGMAALLAWENDGRRQTSHAGAGATEEPVVSGKSRRTALLLCVFLGGFGAHRYYIGKLGTGTAMLPLGILAAASLYGGAPFLTVLTAWILVDLLKIATGNMRDIEGRRITEWRSGTVTA